MEKTRQSVKLMPCRTRALCETICAKKTWGGPQDRSGADHHMSEDKDKAELAGVRVLVVDDDEAIRLLTHRILASRGCAVESAINGRDALQTLLRHNFDLAVVDLRMQEMDGVTFIQESRNIWPWLGFIVLTGYADDVSNAQMASMGITRIMEKPVRPGALTAAVAEEVVQRRRKMGEQPEVYEQHQRQMRILSQLGETAFSASTLVEALRDLSDGLGDLLSCDLTGLLGVAKDEQIVAMSLQTPVSAAFLKCAEDEIVKRYEALGGRGLNRSDLRIQIEGALPAPEGPSTPGRMLTIPILSGSDIQGMLLLASASSAAMQNVDVSFLYHVANVLSSILATVNRMRQLAVRDGLTGLYNRAQLEEEMERAWLLARRHSYDMGVAIMDIDHFKALNDTHGHLAGDRVLKEFADLLRGVARTTDIVGRYGGDEFVIILPQTDAPACLSIGNRIIQAVESHLFCPDTLRIKFTASVGIATSRAVRPTDRASEVLRLADMALYSAKNEGRNRVRVWTPERIASAEATAPLAGPEQAGAARGRILVVDDDPQVLDLLTQRLRLQGFQVQPEASAAEALRRLEEKSSRFDVVITDLNMPEHGGLSLLEAIRTRDSMIVAIVLTGFGTKENAIGSLRHGAFDFIEKPVTGEALIASVEKAMDHRRLRTENERYRLRLEEMVRQKSTALVEALEQLKGAHSFTLQAMAGLLDAREHATGQHSVRVRDITIAVGRTLGMPQKDLDILGQAALLHDIGKIAVPDAILLKPGALNEEEWRVMRQHPEVGYNVLRASPHLAPVAEIVYSHQERFDGSGYPRGLRGSQICMGARIFAVVDAYDAMRSHRPYRKAMSPPEALEEIRRGSGKLFDPAVVDVLCRCQAELEHIGGWISS